MIGGLVVGRKWCRYWSSSTPNLPLWQPWLWALCWWCCPSWDPPCTFDQTVSMRLWKTWKTDSPDNSDQFIPSNSVKRKSFVEVRKIRKPTFLLFFFICFHLPHKHSCMFPKRWAPLGALLSLLTFVVTFCFWQRIRSIFRMNAIMVFLDKLCIAQHDARTPSHLFWT